MQIINEMNRKHYFSVSFSGFFDAFYYYFTKEGVFISHTVH